MRWLAMIASIALVCSFVGSCGDDAPPPSDGSIDSDARLDAVVDSAADTMIADTSPPEPMCGNGVIEAGESCDDGNDVTGDGCTPDCLLEAGCGDSVIDAPEICDDGNHLDGDGCRGDCASDESCGNGDLDLGAAELCDDGNTDDGDGCSGDCTVVEGCGDGTMSGSETCDDGNLARWDGCGPDCRSEQSLVVNTLQVPAATVGCDLNADGAPDNLFATALGRILGIQNAQLQTSIDGGALLLLLPFYGLDSATSDDFFVTSVATALDADTDRMNNFTGSAELFAHLDSLRGDGLPRTVFPARIASSMLTAGPADLDVLLIVSTEYPATMVLRNATVTGRIVGSGATITRIEDGQICGALPMNGLAAYDNPLQGVTGFEAVGGCDGQETTSFADVAVAGASLLGLATTPIQPDVDVDRDGLERFEVLREGPAGCQPVIIACIDGDGTRVEGADCDLDPRFADGISSTFTFSAVGANVIGVASPAP